MKQFPVKRWAALLPLLAFIAAGSAEAAGLHRCPHHDVLLGTAAAGAIHNTAGHAAHSGSAPDHAVPAPHDNCTCMGACQPAGVATSVEPGAMTITPDAGHHDAADRWTPPAPRTALVPFALPFPNGPPTR